MLCIFSPCETSLDFFILFDRFVVLQFTAFAMQKFFMLSELSQHEEQIDQFDGRREAKARYWVCSHGDILHHISWDVRQTG